MDIGPTERIRGVADILRHSLGSYYVRSSYYKFSTLYLKQVVEQKSGLF